ncbi:pirin family protein [Janibacter sp. G56]|uniref:pirin family protein n=1 Tax=Janibacter sp. G56 TaxID=3418717 RepID=UPI003D01ADEF
MSPSTDPEVLLPREVPLGGPRAMLVRRTLPHRDRVLIGAWCFVDHYGPDDVSATGGMDVAPHPHTGLQTVTWLFEGEVEHRDAQGVHALVRSRELNLMRAGHGTSHSEVSTPDTTILHGAQLWLVSPEATRDMARDFEHHVPEVTPLDGGEAAVFIGTLASVTSPVQVDTPLVGAEVIVEAGASVTLALDATFEHGVLVDRGPVTVDAGRSAPVAAESGSLVYLEPGRTELTLAAGPDEAGRVLLIGGEPFDEEIVMWWNFIGRTHDEIEEFRAEWEAGAERFGRVDGYEGTPQRLPAPALPHVRLKPRGRLRRP